jgi:endonuclease YncB( thermonuclease family)
VISVVDGDTIKVVDEAGKKLNVRFAEIDAPEKKQPFGQAARHYLDSHLKLNDYIVYLKVDSKDRWGRLIAWVYYDEEKTIDVNRLLIYKGHAWHYKAYSKDKTLAAWEQEARNEKRGLWASENPIAPWEWRKGKR